MELSDALVPSPLCQPGPDLACQWLYCLHARFHLDRLTVSLLGGKNPQIWQYFPLQHSLVAPLSGTETKLKAGAQQQTSPVQ